MLADRVKAVKDYFGVSLVDYGRENATGVLFSSGCGIGLALMDVCEELRYFEDVDNYRSQQIDWESVGVILAAAKPSVVVLAGWFSIDRPATLLALQRGFVDVRVLFYEGGSRPISDLIAQIKKNGVDEATPRSA
jgi:hypothetical protein